MADEQTRTIALDPERLRLSKYTLEVTRGPAAGARRTFDRRLVYVGSSPECAFSLDDPTVSRTHCKIEVDHRGYRLRDLDSKNGTWVAGVRVADAWLPTDGAPIRVGNSELRFSPLSETVEVELSRRDSFGRLTGKSLQMREIFAMLERVAPTDVTVLIEGESGTGKELVAQAIHENSRRARGPFIIFDCSAVPENLIESELFGHVKGAFTGATASRTGAFQAATGGTLFLDEVGELLPSLQPKLLRALESREVKPVGSNAHVKTDVRIVAATNRSLEAEVQEGRFREDLFYRLAVVRVPLPPLRERPEDIPLLVQRFLEALGPGQGRDVNVSYETMAKLQKHDWPGNVRELKNFVERAALLSDTGRIETRFIDDRSHGMLRDRAADAAAAAGDDEAENVGALRVDYDLPFKDAKARLIDVFERSYWRRQLESAGGNISEAARRTGIHRKSLEYLLRKLDIRAK
jgi:DNA-binding NtrC family response regulator